ncbi:helix-turn-helix transcriptional regulator [Priestia aryabhattai]|uniref:helix-turn-helix domain-containing protein n=1 Tax=Priestia aryabhattai TaxID=412384 RepID=UPI001EBB7B3D|nr:helix-turn-helix transcriptional regulator [Priestia aryabhattai]MBY0091577.1 helix-turn-helix transcriptional regulator [Priestia aryabhattai]MBY0104201.1 helix-turn-helix transcriptional regulator [Priestia aryabhattai]
MIGPRIREIRSKKKISLSQLAQRSDVTKSYLSQIERNICTNPSIEFVEKIAAGLNIEPEILVGWAEDKAFGSSDSFAHMQEYLFDMDNEQLKELKEYIDFTLWKRSKK